MTSQRWLIDKFFRARRHYTYGSQYDNFDHCNPWLYPKVDKIQQNQP